MDYYTKKTAKRQLKDPWSAITHFIGIIMVIIAGIPLFAKASVTRQENFLTGSVIFFFGMIGLYTASTIYHALDINERVNTILRKIDHAMIFVLIAGTYTPICIITLWESSGPGLLIAIWAIALIGILVKVCWITCPKWFSSVVYIAMGWTCVFSMSDIIEYMPTAAFVLLFAGGAIYTVGGVIYALKLQIFNSKHKEFGSHEVFHLFVMGGSICHFAMMFFL